MERRPQPRHPPEPTPHFTRNRVVVIAASLFAMLVAAALVWLAMTTLPQQLDTSRMLPIKEVIFVGDMQRVDAAALTRVAGGIRGSMLRTDLNEVKAAIRQIHWVRNADVRRRFPATLEVKLEEHRAFARWKDADVEQETLVNTFGEVFAAELDGDLPVFSGPPGTSREVMAGYTTFKARLSTIGRSPSAIALSARRAWQIRLDNGTALELGRSEAVDRLDRYVKAYPAVTVLQTANAHVDLRYQSGMAVKLADAKSAAPAAAVVPKPTTKTIAKS